MRKIEKSKKLFPVPVEKEIRKVETISYKIKRIDSAKCMASSLSNLVDNPTEGIHKIKYKDRGCFLDYESVKYSLKYNINVHLAIKIIQSKLMKN